MIWILEGIPNGLTGNSKPVTSPHNDEQNITITNICSCEGKHTGINPKS